jgi:hypothetical protein
MNNRKFLSITPQRFSLYFSLLEMDAKPSKTHLLELISSQTEASAETTNQEAVIDELVKRLTPLLIEKIEQLITDALACKCCS